MCIPVRVHCLCSMIKSLEWGMQASFATYSLCISLTSVSFRAFLSHGAATLIPQEYVRTKSDSIYHKGHIVSVPCIRVKSS